MDGNFGQAAQAAIRPRVDKRGVEKWQMPAGKKVLDLAGLFFGRGIRPQRHAHAQPLTSIGWLYGADSQAAPPFGTLGGI